MCGILGIVAATGKVPRVSRGEMLAMRDTMTARGPDGAGEYHKRNVLFAHRRLAIRDLPGGSQPWVSEDESCVLVYNGEIYNDGELRRELEDTGHQFCSRCDTEVVLAAYQQWGSEFLKRLRGMFALGIYDFPTETLLLARDRFGIKPLFVTEVDGCIAFASSIPALLRHPHVIKQPNFRVLSHYLTTLRLTLGRETVYENIWQLLPGEVLLLQDGQIHINRYWQYPEGEDSGLTFDDAASLLDERLREATRIRLVSDVPVGLFLSGGVDSSVLAHVVRDLSDRPLMTHCGGSNADDEEITFARQCAHGVGFGFDEVVVTADQYRRDWEWMIGEYGTPVSTPSDVIIFNIAKRLKQHVGVALGGEGADELLCGYNVQHWSGNDFDLQKQLMLCRWNAGPSEQAAFQESFRRAYGRDSFPSLMEMYFAMNSLIPSAAKESLLQPYFWKEAERDEVMHEYYAGLFRESSHRTSASQMQRVLQRVNLEALLSRLDTATMLGSLEARVPFTDHLLVEAMSRVPHRHLIGIVEAEDSTYLSAAELERRSSLQGKRVLRRVASRTMPRDLAMRRKASFPTAAETWLTNDWSRWVSERLRHSEFGRDLFQRDAIDEIVENIPAAGMWLWPLMNVINWGDQVFGNRLASAA